MLDRDKRAGDEFRRRVLSFSWRNHLGNLGLYGQGTISLSLRGMDSSPPNAGRLKTRNAEAETNI
jgi:hypothetical protein